MIARIRKSIDEKEKGFTLIELLVVIIIIGILSAIAIPLFLNQRKKAVDAGIKSDLRTVATEVETVFTDAQAYPTATEVVFTAGTATTPATVTIGGSANNLTVGNKITYKLNGTDAFCLFGINDGGTSKTLGFSWDSKAGGLRTGAAADQSCVA